MAFVLLLSLAFGAAIAGAAETLCWSVREWKGAPALFRNGKPTVPLMFWMREYQAQDVTTGRTVATDADRFVHPMGRFRTAVFLMED